MEDVVTETDDKKITRREFLKKAAVGAVGLGVGLYAIDKLLFKKTLSQISQNLTSGLGVAPSGDAPADLWKWSKEAYNYIKLGENVKCQNCPHGCLLQKNERSICRNKVNKDGKLYTLAYGNPCSVYVDPVEKKPLFHFLPGSTAFSIATAGCNFRCKNCQNWEISQSRPEDTQNYDMMPERVVEGAKSNNCASIAYTYSEPNAYYEYMYDTSKIARASGVKNLWITNGYLNEKPVRDLCEYIDAANVDLKSFKESIYNDLNAGTLQPVLDTLKTLKDENVWFEVTNLVVPTYTDDLDMISEMCGWLVKNISTDYPLHFSRFHSVYKLANLPPTPVDFLEKVRKIALDAGLKFVYIGNVPGHEAQNTYCPKDGKVAISRDGYSVKFVNFENGYCKSCGEKIPGVWR